MATATTIPSQRQLVQDWLRYSIQDLQKSMRKRGISRKRNRLLNSISGLVATASDDTVSRVTLKFLQYGRFVDMGVGRGVPVGSQAAKADFLKYRNKKGQLHHKNRKAKKWYSRTWPGKERDLAGLLYENYGIRSLQVVESSLKSNVNIEF